MPTIRVLIIDDSALIRQMLTQIIASAADIEVIGTAADPYIAREKIKRLSPDVLTLDVEMPRMDGLAFLKNLMRLRPMPVIMISALTEKGADVTFKALEYGAVDFVCKPQLDVAATFNTYASEIIEKIRIAAQAKVKPLNIDKKQLNTPLHIVPKYSADEILEISQRPPAVFKTTERVIAIGASTGGTEAIKAILVNMPPDSPGIVISQHIPAMFSRSFAQHMDRISPMSVHEAQDGDVILPGHVYISPGSHHLLVVRDGARYVCRLNEGNPVNRHRPSVDVLFRSVAQYVGHNSIGIILTGMGDDGARGLKEMHEAGATTMAQDEYTSVVWGMPREAIKQEAVDHIVSLHNIVNTLIQLCHTPRKKR